jgi:2-amino-4-hydroxy-6-hydroxymethyldihydropteridine diphosphokinase
MARIFISIGSNIEPFENVRKALIELKEVVDIRAISTVYLTEPYGPGDVPDYLNCMVEVETNLDPVEFKFSVIRIIEKRLGRVRGEDRFAPRTIDLDIIIYGNLMLNEDGVIIPDPAIREMPFLAIPLYEIAPDLVIPGWNITVSEIAEKMAPYGMEPLDDFTESLRKLIGQN